VIAFFPCDKAGIGVFITFSQW